MLTRNYQEAGVVILHHAEAVLGKAEALEEPQDDGGGQNHGARPLDKGPAPLPGGAQHVAPGGNMTSLVVSSAAKAVAAVAVVVTPAAVKDKAAKMTLVLFFMEKLLTI